MLTTMIWRCVQRFNGDKLSKFTVKLTRGNPASIKAAVPWADQNDVEDVPEEEEEDENDLPAPAAAVSKISPRAWRIIYLCM